MILVLKVTEVDRVNKVPLVLLAKMGLMVKLDHRERPVQGDNQVRMV